MRKNLFALALAALAAAASPATAAPSVFHRIVPLPGQGRVVVDTHNGSVAVATWNQPSVGIDATIEPGPMGGTAEDVKNVEIVIGASGSQVRIESNYDKVETHLSWFGFSKTLPLIHYKIHVPPSAAVDLTAHNATIGVAGVGGSCHVSTHNGDVSLTDLRGAADVSTHNGEVRLTWNGPVSPAKIVTHNGSCDVSVPAGAHVSFVTSSNHGRAIQSELPLATSSSAARSVATLNGGGPEVNFDTHNGMLHLTKR